MYLPFATSNPLFDAFATPCRSSFITIKRLSFLDHSLAIEILLSVELLLIKIHSKSE